MSGAADGLVVDVVNDVLPCRAPDGDQMLTSTGDVQWRCRCRLVKLELLMLR